MRYPMNPDGAAGPEPSCPCCGGSSFEEFEDVLDVDGKITMIEICEVCSNLVNRAGLKAVAADAEAGLRAQTAGLHEVYPTDPRAVAFGATLGEEVPRFVDVLSFFLREANIDRAPQELVSAEIGIGRGSCLRAAASLFRKSYGTDVDYTLFDVANSQLALPDNVVLLESLSHLPEPVDLIVGWHVFEHVPRLHDLVAAMRLMLRQNGHIFFQVPLYRPENIVQSHYSFLNRRAVKVLAEMQRLDVVGIWTDHARSFLTVILRKPDED